MNYNPALLRRQQHGGADRLCRQTASDIAVTLLQGYARRILATAVQLPDRRSDAPPPFPEGNVQANLTRRFPKIAMSETRRKTACRSRRYFAHSDRSFSARNRYRR